MPGPTLTVDELAEELGRKSTWLYDNWREEMQARRLPSPLNGARPPLVWDRAQVYAVRDRELTRAQQVAAAAIRAALAAADDTRLTHAGNVRLADDRAALDARFAPQPLPTPNGHAVNRETL